MKPAPLKIGTIGFEINILVDLDIPEDATLTLRVLRPNDGTVFVLPAVRLVDRVAQVVTTEAMFAAGKFDLRGTYRVELVINDGVRTLISQTGTIVVEGIGAR